MSDQTEGRERLREGMRGENGNQNYISMREHEERGREEQQECPGAREEGKERAALGMFGCQGRRRRKEPSSGKQGTSQTESGSRGRRGAAAADERRPGNPVTQSSVPRQQSGIRMSFGSSCPFALASSPRLLSSSLSSLSLCFCFPSLVLVSLSLSLSPFLLSLSLLRRCSNKTRLAKVSGLRRMADGASAR